MSAAYVANLRGGLLFAGFVWFALLCLAVALVLWNWPRIRDFGSTPAPRSLAAVGLGGAVGHVAAPRLLALGVRVSAPHAPVFPRPRHRAGAR